MLCVRRHRLAISSPMDGARRDTKHPGWHCRIWMVARASELLEGAAYDAGAKRRPTPSVAARPAPLPADATATSAAADPVPASRPATATATIATAALTAAALAA